MARLRKQPEPEPVGPQRLGLRWFVEHWPDYLAEHERPDDWQSREWTGAGTDEVSLTAWRACTARRRQRGGEQDWQHSQI